MTAAVPADGEEVVDSHEDALREEGRYLGCGFDPCSSSAWFDGWHPGEPRPPPPPGEPVVTEARSWLARTGWRRHGLLRPSEVAAAWAPAAR